MLTLSLFLQAQRNKTCSSQTWLPALFHTPYKREGLYYDLNQASKEEFGKYCIPPIVFTTSELGASLL